MTDHWKRRRCYAAVLACTFTAAIWTAPQSWAMTAPGGFMESAETTTARGIPTPQEIQTFMSNRGVFTFPAPWNTRGIRITNASDCGGNDCVDYIGYSYWRNMSNSAGSNTMYIFVGLDRSRGGAGPTLFELDKDTDQLTEVGPLFPPSSPYSWYTGEGWYFSYSMPTKIYIDSGPQLLLYDVLAHTFQTVFDASTEYGNVILTQTSSSNNDVFHAGTLEDGSTYEPLGCLVFRSDTGQSYLFRKTGTFDECQIDKSGRFVVIKEKTPHTCNACDEDNIIVDLAEKREHLLLDQDGAGGHSDLGYGYMVAADNWYSYPNSWRLWDFANAPFSDGLVTHNLSWSAFDPEHVSFENAVPNVPIAQQYACGSAANRAIVPHSNEITCFMLDGSVPPQSEQVLVVAPVMTDLDAAGGGNSDYAKEPKGNIDPTGHYFIWTSNLGGNRLDAFIVEIPYQVMTGAAPGLDVTPPRVGILAPLQGASVAGTVIVAANAVDDRAVARVQFYLDGKRLGAPLFHPPYRIEWNTRSETPGPHTLTASAEDASSNRSVSQAVTVITGTAGGNSP